MAFMSERVDVGFATLEEAADFISAYLPHRPRPKDLSGLAKNLRLHPDGRYRWHWILDSSRAWPKVEARMPPVRSWISSAAFKFRSI
jgi:hypothetical protein